ncbi:MAG: type II toxin-antitoxin system RelE/ParE family toxin [Deltaproteobacteria bacterium]|nr:type II toxin-antitoxin system RelE/ParE family toxin [Deltaproteobacteria bacterium]
MRSRRARDISKQISKLHPALKSKIRSALEEIKENPFQGKPLRDDLKGLYSYRVSHHRIIYSIHRNILEVHVIGLGPRKTIYKITPRPS